MLYSIIIPCYNEAQNIEKLINELNKVDEKRNIEYVIVDNGSIDDTRNKLKILCQDKDNIKLVYIDNNIGYGNGIKQGIIKASGDYIGWIHADLQVNPINMINFIDYVESYTGKELLFLKGKRKNRTVVENFFTAGMTIVASFILRRCMHDIGAIPVLFNKKLINIGLEKVPNDFSIETYFYYIAKIQEFKIIRFPVILEQRFKGKSSWNNGLKSRIKQSILIMKDIIKIKKNGI